MTEMSPKQEKRGDPYCFFIPQNVSSSSVSEPKAVLLVWKRVDKADWIWEKHPGNGAANNNLTPKPNCKPKTKYWGRDPTVENPWNTHKHIKYNKVTIYRFYNRLNSSYSQQLCHSIYPIRTEWRQDRPWLAWAACLKAVREVLRRAYSLSLLH